MYSKRRLFVKLNCMPTAFARGSMQMGVAISAEQFCVRLARPLRR